MMELMNRLTDKTGWETKVFDEEIVAKWKAEAIGAPEIDISENMVDWVSHFHHLMVSHKVILSAAIALQLLLNLL